jgi:hypothetical protein
VQIDANRKAHERPTLATAKTLLWIFGGIAVATALGVAGFLHLSQSTQAQIGQYSDVYAADGGGESAQENRAATQHPPACDLVSKQEVALATKTDIAEATSDEDRELCTYTPAHQGATTVSVQVAWQGGRFALHAGDALMQSAAGGAQIHQMVQGIGDEAFVLGAGQEAQDQISRSLPPELKALATVTTGPLTFRKGDVMVTVTANFIDNKFEAEKQIAAKVASRL